jgi:hypothetical protein
MLRILLANVPHVVQEEFIIAYLHSKLHELMILIVDRVQEINMTSQLCEHSI